MNDIQLFKNDDFGELRTMEQEGKTLFCTKDKRHSDTKTR